MTDAAMTDTALARLALVNAKVFIEDRHAGFDASVVATIKLHPGHEVRFTMSPREALSVGQKLLDAAREARGE